MQLYHKSNIDQLEWPNHPDLLGSKELLLSMIKEGVASHIGNVETQLYLLKVGDTLLPVTVNDRQYNNSYLTSNYFPVKYLKEAFSKRLPKLNFLKSAIECVGWPLKFVKINKAVIVNNWLLTTNIYPAQIEKYSREITQFLTQAFPKHALFFRSLSSYDSSPFRRALKNEGYRFFPSRLVHIYDPSKKKELSSKAKYHHRKDRSLIAEEGYTIFWHEDLTDLELKVCLELYRKIYLQRYTEYSPQYTFKFLKLAISTGLLKMIGLKKEGAIVGMMGYTIRHGIMTIPFFGYEPNEGKPNHLYRMMTILGVDAVEREGAILNDGSGASEAKQYRGMKPYPEHVAMYDRHLPAYRRFFWQIAEKFSQRWSSLDTTDLSQT